MASLSTPGKHKQVSSRLWSSTGLRCWSLRRTDRKDYDNKTDEDKDEYGDTDENEEDEKHRGRNLKCLVK